MINGVGKGGNPQTMQITPGMVVGVGTDIICGEHLIATPGGIDIGFVFSQSNQSVLSSLGSGITTLFGGGTGSMESGLSNCTPGPNHIKYMIQSTDELPMNFGFYSKANSSTRFTDASGMDLPREIEDQLIAGAIGLRVSEASGATLAAIDACLRVADFHDVAAIVDIDSLNESYDSDCDLKGIIKNRVALVPLNRTVLTSTYLNELLTQNSVLGVSSLESTILEEHLHDLGLISIVTSSSFDSNSQQRVRIAF